MEKLEPLVILIGINDNPKKLGRIEINKSHSGIQLHVFLKEKAKFPKYSLPVKELFARIDDSDPSQCSIIINSNLNNFTFTSNSQTKQQLQNFWLVINKNSVINKDNYDDSQIAARIRESWPFLLH